MSHRVSTQVAQKDHKETKEESCHFVKQNANTMIVALQNKIPAAIGMWPTCAPIVALDESNYDDMEMMGWICNRHGGRTKQLSDYSVCRVLEVF